jgi:hypothetical protein
VVKDWETLVRQTATKGNAILHLREMKVSWSVIATPLHTDITRSLTRRVMMMNQAVKMRRLQRGRRRRYVWIVCSQLYYDWQQCRLDRLPRRKNRMR